MASEALFQALAQALSQPSKAYRATQEGLGIPGQAIQGYEAGAELADKIRQRKLAKQSLTDVLGTIPERIKPYGGMSVSMLHSLGGLKGLADITDQQKPVEPHHPSGLDEILAENVNSGKMTMEQAAKVKRSMSPSFNRPPPPDRSMLREIAKAKANLATTRPIVESAIKEIQRVQKLNANSYGGVLGAGIMKSKSSLNLGTDNPKFKNTSDVINTMQSQVAKVLKSTFGGQLSDSERSYLNEVYGAIPRLSPQERNIAMNNVQKMLTDKLSGAQQAYTEMAQDSGAEPIVDENSGNSDPLGLFK